MTRKYKQLSKDDRIKIHTLLSCNKTQTKIKSTSFYYFFIK